MRRKIMATLALIALGAPLLSAAFRKEDVRVHKLDNGQGTSCPKTAPTRSWMRSRID